MALFRSILRHKAEVDLGSLSLFAMLFNIADLAMFYVNFWQSKGGHPYPVPEQMMMLLWASVLIFAVPKEITRWTHPKSHKSTRRGQLFPLLWCVSTGFMGITEWFTNGRYRVPEYMGMTMLGTVAIFLASLSSKWLHNCRNGDKDCLDERELGMEDQKTAPGGQ